MYKKYHYSTTLNYQDDSEKFKVNLNKTVCNR